MSARWMVVVAVLLVGSAASADAPAPSTAAVTQVAVVSGTTCALHADGSVSCWGRELDRSQKDPRIHARPLGVPLFHDVVQLDGVFGGICARYRDGTVQCLGMSPASPPSALEPQPLHDVVDLRGSCARGRDGHVSCFDGKAWAQVPHIDDAVDAYGDDGTGCAVHKDTTVSCWSGGPGAQPELVGAAADGSAQLVAGVTGAVQVSVGLYFGCARLRDGRVTCWGNNAIGELGRGALDDDYSAFHKAALVSNVTDAVDLITGAGHACIRRKAGPLACWGEFPWDLKKHPSVTVIRGLEHVTAVAGADPMCAVGKGRDVWCLGSDHDGELGNGLSAILDAALPIAGVHDATQILATTLGTCALRGKGELTCWGAHDTGPGKLRGMTHLSQSTRGFSGSYLTGLDAQGRLWIDGEDKPRKLPKGTAHAGVCVIANGGEVWCNAITMGSRGPVSGQLADVTDAVEITGSLHMAIRHRTGAISTFTTDTALSGHAPTDVPVIDDAIALASGEEGTRCAIRADHTVWCWDDGAKPAQVAGVTDAVSLAISDEMRSPIAGTYASAGFACAVKLDGSVVCWGENRHGQLGDGTRISSKTPVATRGVTDAIQVAAGWLHACALEKSGAVACWGSTEEGAGGTPRTDRIDHPVAVLWP